MIERTTNDQCVCTVLNVVEMYCVYAVFPNAVFGDRWRCQWDGVKTVLTKMRQKMMRSPNNLILNSGNEVSHIKNSSRYLMSGNKVWRNERWEEITERLRGNYFFERAGITKLLRGNYCFERELLNFWERITVWEVTI